jgi:CBS domain-containing protein
MGSGLWWILLGLFVVTMASAEELQARTGAALAGVRVRDVMTPNPDTVHGDVSVADFLRDVALLRLHSAFPLLDSVGRLQGLVTLNRLRSVPPDRRALVTLREIACPPAEIPLTHPDEPLSDLLPRLGGCADGRALVFADGHLVGILTPSDISRAVAVRGLARETGGADLTHALRR